MKLADMDVKTFTDAVACDSPAPGGGSVAALAGSIGSALTAMVACLTQGRKKYKDHAAFARKAEEKANELKARLMDVMDRDTDAFRRVSEAFAMPKETEEEKAARSEAIQEGLKACTETPMEMMELMEEAVVLADSLRREGFNDSAASDLGVAFLMLQAGIRGAWLNVLINISSLKDREFAEEYRARGKALLARALPLASEGYEKIVDMVWN